MQGHPLTPRYGFIMDGSVADIVRNVRGILIAGTWAPNSARGYSGTARKHTATTDRVDIGLDSELLTTGPCSIVLGYQKTDAVARGSVAFGTTTGTTSTCDAYVPFSDNVVYWDYGGTAGGSTRLTASGLTFGDDIWAFTQGLRGAEIWQNGILRAANGSNNVRVNAGTQFMLGKNNAGSGQLSDLALWKFFYIYHRQILRSEISDLVRTPYSWVER